MECCKTNGNIKITGNEEKDVIIEAIEDSVNFTKNMSNIDIPQPKPNINIYQHNNQNDSIDNKGLKKIKTKLQDYDIVKEENKIYITSNNFFRSNNSFIFNIKVPANCSVVANTLESIEINGAEGDFELNTVYGSINATEISGSIVANTVSGAIKVQIKKAKSYAPMAFSSVSGIIDVTLPADIKANLKMNSEFGEKYTNFDTETKDNNVETTNNPNKEKYRVNVKNWSMAEINGGGPEISFNTLSGKVCIRKK